MGTILGEVESIYNQASLVLKYNAWVGTNETYGVNYNLSNPHWNNDTNTMVSPNHANIIYFYFSSNPRKDDGSVLVACHLHNATYNVGFSFENSQQSINVQSVTTKEAVPYNADRGR